MSVGIFERSFRFGVSGILATTVYVITAVALINLLQLSQVVANEIAFCVGTFVSYSLNTVWSFSSRPTIDSLLRFFVVAVVGFIATTVIASTAQHAGWSYGIGIFLIIVIVPPFTFFLHSVWTFRNRGSSRTTGP